MVMKLDQLVNGAINVGFGAAAVAVEGGKKVLDDLNTKGEQVRKDAGAPDIARSVSDMFEQAGGTISDLTERLGMQGETAAQRVLDELILARVRVMTASERTRLVGNRLELPGGKSSAEEVRRNAWELMRLINDREISGRQHAVNLPIRLALERKRTQKQMVIHHDDLAFERAARTKQFSQCSHRSLPKQFSRVLVTSGQSGSSSGTVGSSARSPVADIAANRLISRSLR